VASRDTRRRLRIQRRAPQAGSGARRPLARVTRSWSGPPNAPRLHYSDALSRSILETVPGGIVHVRADGAILRANAEALRVLGLSYDALTQRYTNEFETETIWEDGSRCPADMYPVARTLATGEAQPATTIGVRRPDGETSWAVFRALPLRDEVTGELTGAIVTFLDITERKAAEAAREALEVQLRHAQRLDSIGQLAGGIAHDFNNLLQIILGNVELCAAGDTVQPLADIRSATERASELTEGLLAFARRQPVTRSNVDLGDLVRGAQRLLKPLFGKSIILDYPPGQSSGTISADRNQIEQAFINLCLNARDAMPGGGTIRVVTERVRVDASFAERHAWATARSYLALRVHDDGPGIRSDHHTRIFEPFFTTKPLGRGTGLGLSVVYGVMQSHAGAVTVDSAPGQGATFTLYFPEATAASEPVEEAPKSQRTGGQERILVVEDEDMIRRLVVRLLETRGYDVLAAGSGHEALDLLSNSPEPIELLFVDEVMPGMRGTEFVRQARVIDPGLRALFTTGYELDSTHAESIGGDPVLYKPYTPDQLLRNLRELLDRIG
jgi:two-component system cell cycle sensor histidine kinase/response regulator CckA